MGFRIIKINNRCKLETSLNYLVCRSDVEKRILLDEISVLIIENAQVCITSSLISELMNHKVRVIFCDVKHNPQGELEPYAGCYDSPNKIKTQINWNQSIQDQVWSYIVREKIYNQSLVLKYSRHDDIANLLLKYKNEITLGDSTNREGLAAKSYFAALFGLGFERRNERDVRNSFLDYGYSLLLSIVSREIAISGYLNSIGIHHIGTTNHYNLACDFMEPLRPFIDMMIVKNMVDKDNFKRQLIGIYETEVRLDNKKMFLENAIHNYVQSLFGALSANETDSISRITFLDEQL